MTPGNVLLLVTIALVTAVLATALAVRRRAAPLARLDAGRDDVVVTLTAPVWLGYKRRLSAPRSAVTGARVVPAGSRVPLTLRLCGLGLGGFHLGWFWRRGTGHIYVARRLSRDAVLVDLTGGRVRQWLVEVESPPDAVAALAPPTP